MEIAKIDSVDGSGEKVLFYVRGSDAAFGTDLERPAMRRAAFVDYGALHPLVERADEQCQGASAGMAGAADSTRVDFRTALEIIDRPHAIPDAVVRQILAHEQESLAGHGVLVDGVVDVGPSGFRIPVLPAFTLADRIVRQHDEPGVDHVEIRKLILGLHAGESVMPAW